MATNYKINSFNFEDFFIPREPFSDGGLWSWGYNVYGQLGDNTTADKSSPVQTVAGGINWKQVNTGLQHSAAIKTDGTLWLWGRNNYGQIGDNTVTDRSSPVQTVAFGTNWKQVVGAWTHAAAIKTDGTLWCWGHNNVGQLGITAGTWTSSPIQTVAYGNNWKLVSAGRYSTAAIKTDGTLWLWGYNFYGQLGDNTTTNRASPVQTVSGGTNWKLVSCFSGTSTVAAIKTDGTLWLWGRNDNGGLGDNTITNKSSPVQTVAGGTNWKMVSSGDYHVGAIKTDGTLWLWGKNNYGQLGTNNTTYRSSPVQTITGGTNWKQVNGGGAVTSAIKTDGTLWCWGVNSFGRLGDNTTTHRSSPVQTVAGGINWKQVSISTFTLAIKDDSPY